MGKSEGNIKISEQESDVIEIDLMELLLFFRSQLLLLIFVTLLGGLLAGELTYHFVTPKYTATAKVYIVSASSDSVIDLNDLNLGTTLSKDYVELVKLRPLLEDVIEDLGLEYSASTLLEMISVSTIDDTRLLEITAESTSPQEAADIANEIATKTVSYIPTLMEAPEPHIAETALVPTVPSSPSMRKNITIGAAGFLAVVLLIMTVIFLMDDTFKSADEVEKAFGVMPLTVIPEGKIGSASVRRMEKKRKKRRRKGKHEK